MFLCLGDIKYASSMSQGSNKADSMYLRHKNRDSEFLKIECLILGNIQIDPPPHRESSFFWRLGVDRNAILTSCHRKNNVSILSILPGGGGQLGKDGFVMLLARWRDSTNMKLHRRRILEIYTIWGPQKWTKLSVIYVISLIWYSLYLILCFICYCIYFIYYLIYFIILYYILYIWGLV